MNKLIDLLECIIIVLLLLTLKNNELLTVLTGSITFSICYYISNKILNLDEDLIYKEK